MSAPQTDLAIAVLADILDERALRAIDQLGRIIERYSVHRAQLLYDELTSLFSDADMRDAGQRLAPAAAARLDSTEARRVLYRTTDGQRRPRGGSYFVLAERWRRRARRANARAFCDAIAVLATWGQR